MPRAHPSRRRCRPLVAAVLAVTLVPAVGACTTVVSGQAERETPGVDDASRSPVDVDGVLLEQSRMQAITGAGDDLTIIPSMDGKRPVDIDTLMRSTPSPCQWYFAETQTFGTGVEEFHKTTYQDPPDGALISQGAAGYRDVATARRALDDLSHHVTDCETTPYGGLFVGESSRQPDALRLRSGACGRDYRVKSVVLVEVTYCRFPPSVPEIVMTNVVAQIPG